MQCNTTLQVPLQERAANGYDSATDDNNKTQMIEHGSIWEHFLAGKPFVKRDGQQLTLQFSPASIQSQLCLDEPNRLQLGYTRTLLGFLLFAPQPRNITMIGLGGGSLPKYCYNALPDTNIAVVEINADVIALRDTFMVPKDSERFAVHCADGAVFVAEKTGTEDVIVVDGFDVGGQAPTLCTEEFYRHCYQALADNGVMAVNLSENAKQHSTFIYRMRRVFSDAVFVVSAEDCTNKVVFAVKKNSANTCSEQSLLANAATLDKRHPVSFRQIIERMAGNRHNKLPGAVEQ